MFCTGDTSANSAQIDYWNVTVGGTWAQFQDQLDRQIDPLGLAAIGVLEPAEGEHILDIGCGCGQSSVELAVRVGPSGAVVGVDISKPMLDVAYQRPIPPSAARPIFRQIDAQTGDLGQSTFDAAFSRFGVMFFSDPVAAFANIRKALRPDDGRLTFVCWRPLNDNLWMRAPMEAALPFLPPMPPVDPAAPGPFAFADADHVRSILTGAGFGSVTIERFDARIGGSGVEQTLNLMLRVGPLGAALREHPECTDLVADAVRSTLSQFDTPSGVLMPAAVWIVQGRKVSSR